MAYTNIKYIEYDPAVFKELEHMLGEVMAHAQDAYVTDVATEAQQMIQALMNATIREDDLAKELAATAERDKGVPLSPEELARWEASEEVLYHDYETGRPVYGIRDMGG